MKIREIALFMLIEKTDFFDLYNLMYFCTASLAIISALSVEIKKDVLVQNKLGTYLVLFPLISLIFLIGFREYNVGEDTSNYYDALWLGNPNIDFSGEFLFDLIAYILRYFNLGYSYFLFFISFLFFLFIYKALRNYTTVYRSNIFITFFSYMSFFFFLSMSINVIRQGVALSILLFAYSIWLKRGNNLRLYLLVFIALAFHLTAIIPVFIFLFSLFINKYKIGHSLIFLTFLYFLAIIMSYNNIGFLNLSPIFLEVLDGGWRAGYFSDEDYGYTIGFKPQFVIFNTFFLLISLYIKSKFLDRELTNKYNVLIFYYIISSIILFMALQLPFSDRWGLFSWIIIPFLISPLFYSVFVRRGIRIHYVLMLVLIFVGFNFYAS